jgi:hypothetical protein
MAWKNLRLFHLDSDRLGPDQMMKELKQFRFDGTEGIKKFQVWDEFDELRIDYLFKVPRFIRVIRLGEGGVLEEEKVPMETFVPVEIHIKSSGLVEVYGSPAFIRKAVQSLSVLGEMDPVVFTQKEFNKVMKMAEAIKKVRVYETQDEHVVEVALFGGSLSSSKELSRYRSKGKVREVSGRMELPGDSYGFSMNEKSVKFFVRDPEVFANDVESFIDSLLS